VWRKNLTVPLTDQLEEHAQRKNDEREQMAIREEMKDQAYFTERAMGEKGAGDEKLYDLDS